MCDIEQSNQVTKAIIAYYDTLNDINKKYKLVIFMSINLALIVFLTNIQELWRGDHFVFVKYYLAYYLLINYIVSKFIIGVAKKRIWRNKVIIQLKT